MNYHLSWNISFMITCLYSIFIKPIVSLFYLKLIDKNKVIMNEKKNRKKNNVCIIFLKRPGLMPKLKLHTIILMISTNSPPLNWLIKRKKVVCIHINLNKISWFSYIFSPKILHVSLSLNLGHLMKQNKQC